MQLPIKKEGRPLRAGILSSAGIGDGLMMLVAAHKLSEEGYQVTLFQDVLKELSCWFPDCRFAKQKPLVDGDLSDLSSCDLLILQHDNRSLAREVIKRSRTKKLPPLITFYPLYEPRRHFPLTSWDVVFDKSKTMVENIGQGIASFFPSRPITFDNGLVVPAHIGCERKHRIVIHPTSAVPERRWSQRKFIAVARRLERRGFKTFFCMRPDERLEWVKRGVSSSQLPFFPNLNALATFIYQSLMLIGNDSGVGHLASNLGVQTLIVAECNKHMTLWRPGWALTDVITPPHFIPNVKGMRLRKERWQIFISQRKVSKAALRGCLKIF